MTYRLVAGLLLAHVTLAFSAAASAESELLLLDNEWSLISPPAGVAGRSVAQVFGGTLPVSGYGSDWAVYAYDKPVAGVTVGYQLLRPADRLVAGEGYWAIQATEVDVRIPMAAAGPDVTGSRLRGCPSVAGCTVVPLAVAPDTRPVTWDMAGLPIRVPTAIADTRIMSDAAVCKLGCTLTQAKTAGLVNDVVWRYRDGAYQKLDDAAMLDPWDGVWAALLPDSSTTVPRWALGLPVPDQRPDLTGDYELVFEEQFTGPELDATRWTTGLLWGPYVVINSEEQLYVDTLGMHASLKGGPQDPFVFTDEGTLKIVATAVEASDVPPQPAPTDEVWGGIQEYRHDPDFDPANVNYLSGILTSYESFKFTHGYTEIRAKIPAGRGLWPAFWMLPTHYVEIIPEIDIMEALGQDPNEVYHTYHYFDRSEGYSSRRTPTYETVGPRFSEDFHTYGVAWEPGQLTFYVDGMEARRVDTNTATTKGDDVQMPYQAMYLIANLAVGGNWPGSPDATTSFPAEYEIDWIKAWKKNVGTPVNLADYDLVFGDEFNGTSLDENTWNTRYIWGPFEVINEEEQYYVDTFGLDKDRGYSPFSVGGGHLTIRAAATGTEPGDNQPYPIVPADDAIFSTQPNFNDTFPGTWHRDDYVVQPYTSGVITSYDQFKFSEGYAEIRAHVPSGDGLWPAFWLLNGYYVGQIPEIDIMEIVGENPGRVQHTYHRLDENGRQTKDEFSSQGGSPAEGFADGFHTFGVQWKRGEIHWYVDGVLTNSYRNADVPYQVMYVIANLAVGGSFNTQAVDPSKLPAELKIDYVRVYQTRTN